VTQVPRRATESSIVIAGDAATSPDHWRLAPGARRIALASLLVLAGALRAWLFVGIVRLDSFRYVEVSHHVLSGGSLFDKSVFFASSRLSMFGPLIASNALLGYGEWACVLFPFVCSIAAVAVVYALGRELVDERVGLLAAFGMAVAPIEVELATALLPDAVESLFLLLAVLFVVLAVRRDRGWAWWAVLSGASLGLAYFARVNALVLLPGLLAAGLMLDRPRWRRTLPVLGGLAAVLALGALAFWLMSGDPFVDWTRMGATYTEYQAGGFLERSSPYVWLLFRQPAIFWVGPLMLAGVGWAFVRRRPAETLLAIWAVGFLLYLDVVSPVHGLALSYRYVEPLVAPVLLLFASGVVGAADRLGASRGRRWAAAAVAAACLLLALLVVPARFVSGAWRNAPRWASVRSIADLLTSEYPSDTVYVDDTLVLVALDYYTGYSYGRDTLEPVGAPVNRGARLFLTSERRPTPSEQGVLVTVQGLPEGLRGQDMVSYPTPDGDLAVWRLTGR
jgi:4-amino-4-deoxy-L-arabinose transferase-like glycosyltransferase